MNVRDRIVDFRRVKASELRPNAKNWRKHPEAQQNAMRGILAEVGYVDALLAREVNGELELIDGHLRAETTPDQEVPVLVIDLDEAESDKILATFDPLAGMAEMDEAKLAELLEGIETDSEALAALLKDLAGEQQSQPVSEDKVSADETETNALLSKWGVEVGQTWLMRSRTGMGEHRIVCGDSATIAGAPRCDGVCTDPPYEIEAGECARTMRRLSDVAVVLCTDKLAFELARHWHVRLDMIWLHRTPKKLPNKNMPIIYHAHVLVLAAAKAVKTGWAKPSPEFGSVIRTEQEYVSQHGHGKSAELFRAMLAGFNWRVVADPYLGSGATLIACEQDGRLCLGIEREPKWVAVSLERAEKFGLSPQLLDYQEDRSYNAGKAGGGAPASPELTQAAKEPEHV